jgi:hypothetical protein
MWENDPALRVHALATVRTALSHQHAAQLLWELHSTVVLALVTDGVADGDRELRASLIGPHLSGLLLNRYLFEVPAPAAAFPGVLIDAAGPVIDHYLSGDLAADLTVR